LIKDPDWPNGRAAINLYFLEEDGQRFKCTVLYSPYLFVCCKNNTEADVEDYLRKEFDQTILKMSRMQKEDLDMVRLSIKLTTKAQSLAGKS
jgi:DNA polymerase epsilon subunit 1